MSAFCIYKQTIALHHVFYELGPVPIGLEFFSKHHLYSSRVSQKLSDAQLITGAILKESLLTSATFLRVMMSLWFGIVNLQVVTA